MMPCQYVTVLGLLVLQFGVTVSAQQQFIAHNPQQQQQQQPPQPQHVIRTFAPVVLNGGGDGSNLPMPPPGFALVPTFAGPFLVPMNSGEQRPPLLAPSSASVRPTSEEFTSRPLSPLLVTPNGQRPENVFQGAIPSGENTQTSSGNGNVRPPVVDFFNPFLSSTQPLFPFHQQSSAPQREPFISVDNTRPRFHTNEHLASVFQGAVPSEPNLTPPALSQNFQPASFQMNVPGSNSGEQQQHLDVQRPMVTQPIDHHNAGQRPLFSPIDTSAQFGPHFVNNQGGSFGGAVSFEPPSTPILPNFGSDLPTNHQETPTTTIHPQDLVSHQDPPQSFFSNEFGLGHSGSQQQQSGENQPGHALPRGPPSSSEQSNVLPHNFFPSSETSQGNDFSGSSENIPPQSSEHSTVPQQQSPQFLPSSETAQGNDFSGSSENIPPSSPFSSFPSTPEFPMAPFDLFSPEVSQRPLLHTPHGSSAAGGISVENLSTPQSQDISSFSGEVVSPPAQENISPFRHHITDIPQTTPSSFTPPHQSISTEFEQGRPSAGHTPSRPHHTIPASHSKQQVPVTNEQLTITTPTSFPDVSKEPSAVLVPFSAEQSTTPSSTFPTLPTSTEPPRRFTPTSLSTGSSLADQDGLNPELLQSPGFVAILSGLQLQRFPQGSSSSSSGEDQLQRPQSTTTRRPSRSRSGRPSTRHTTRPTSRVSRPATTTLQSLPGSEVTESAAITLANTTPLKPVLLNSQRVVSSSSSSAVGSDAQSCDASKCQLPNCFCGGNTLTPGNLEPSDIPQMVLLTFDDSVNDINYQFYSSLLGGGRNNPNGCPISATFYVSHEWTDYAKIQTLYSQGHEIASHSISHSDGAPFSKERWVKEIYGQKQILSALGGVRVGDIRGMRAPFLQGGGNKQFAMLYETNFTYDSSIPSHLNKPPTWPYTLDYRLPHQCGIPPCPNKVYPGVWEVPMVMWEDLKGGHCAMADACQNPTDARGVYDMLVKNFKRHYTSNRAPFGMFYHYAWFTHDHHRDGFMAFMEAILQLPDVYLVTNAQMIEWMRNPTPLSQISSFGPWQCHSAKAQTCSKPKRCSYRFKGDERQFRTCQLCPDKYPWLETYDSLSVIR